MIEEAGLRRRSETRGGCTDRAFAHGTGRLYEYVVFATMTRRAPPAQQHQHVLLVVQRVTKDPALRRPPPSRTRRRVALASRFVMSGPEEASRFAREETPPPSLVPPRDDGAERGASPAPGLSSGGSFEAASPANLASGGLSAHVRSLGWEEREFSDVAVTALGKTYPLHRLVLSRSPYFRALMRGPWADASSTSLTLTFDDPLIDGDAVDAALGFLYGQAPGADVRLRPASARGGLLPGPPGPVRALRRLHRRGRARGDDLGVPDLRGIRTNPTARTASACARRAGVSCALRARSSSPGPSHHLSPATLDKLLRGNDLWVPNQAARYRLASRVISSARAAGHGRLARSGHRRAEATRNDEERESSSRKTCPETLGAEHSEDVLEAEDIAREVVSKMVAVTGGEGPGRLPGRRASLRERRRGKRARLVASPVRARRLFATRRRSARSARPPRRTSRWTRRSR